MWYRVRSIRTYLALALYAAVVFGATWLALGLAITMTVRWRAWEVVGAGVVWDLLWLPAGIDLYHPPLATFLACILVLALEPFRRQLIVD